MYIPGLAILLKIPLVMPFISGHLDKIRGGYERKSAIAKIAPTKPLKQDSMQQSKDSFTVNFPPQFTTNQSNGRMINVRST
jgi:hypothetical protein